MDEMINSVGVQIQREVNDAISSQVLHQIPNALMTGSGHTTQRGWNVPVERPKLNMKVLRNEKSRNISKSERVQNHPKDEPMDNAYDTHLFETLRCV